MPINCVFSQIVVRVEILGLCESRLAIAGVGAARLAQLVGVDAMSISECHAMSWSMPWHGMACRSVSRHQRYVVYLIIHSKLVPNVVYLG